MEARLNVRLFHRTTRSLTLTREGEGYYAHCVRALEELRTGVATLDSSRHEAAGRLRVSAPILFGRRCVAPILTQLVAQYPKLELDLSLSDRPVDLIEDGFDLAIRNGETGDGSGLMTRTISLQRMIVCAAPAYLQAHGTPQSLDDLRNHQAIAYGRARRGTKWQFPLAPRNMTEIAPNSRLLFDDLEAIADATEAGFGLAWLPCWLIREQVKSGKLVPLLKNVPNMVFHIHALWPETPHLPHRLRLAIDALAAALPRSTEL